jgi:hypothetical protein
MYNKAIGEKNNVNYRGLIENMKLSLIHELKSDSARTQKIHNIYTWIGYGYQFLENYDSAYYFYNLSLQMAEKDLQSDKVIQDDLSLLSWLFKTAGNPVKAKEYDVEYQSHLQKSEEKSKKKSLYLLAVGIDNYTNFSYKSAASDAGNLALLIDSLSRQGYDSVHVVVLKNDKASKINIQKEFEKVVFASNQFDLFLFYFAGYSGSDEENNYLATSGFIYKGVGEDSLKNTISAYSLHTMLAGIPANKQLLIFDAEAQKFVSSLLSIESNKKASFNEQGKSMFVICPSETRIEQGEMNQGLLTSAIIDALKGEAENPRNPDGVITAKEMESYVFQTISKPSWHLNFNTYSSGRDFPVSFLSGYDSLLASKTESSVPALRGGSLIVDEASAETVTNTEQTDYALIFGTDNYDEWKKLNNPVFDAKTLGGILEKDYGFKVELVIDATRREIQDKIISYKKRSYNSGDQLFIFFAGHGVYDEENMQEGYIVAKDSKLDDRYKDTYIPFSFLRDHIDGNCQHVLIVLDVCFGGTFGGRLMPMSRGNDDMYQKKDVNEVRSNLSDIKSRYYITSGNKEYVADGTPGKHSPFASFLIDGLIQGATSSSRYITYNDLVTYIDQIKTSTPTHDKFGESEPGGNFIFEVKRPGNTGAFGEKNLTNKSATRSAVP